VLHPVQEQGVQNGPERRHREKLGQEIESAVDVHPRHLFVILVLGITDECTVLSGCNSFATAQSSTSSNAEEEFPSR
jgi:hypothetical protein